MGIAIFLALVLLCALWFTRPSKGPSKAIAPVDYRKEAIVLAQNILANKAGYIIFDTETTGLEYNDVIIHFAVMDLDEQMLIDTKINPISRRRISQEAKEVHGMTLKDLKGAPSFEDVVAQFLPLVVDKKILSYNARFHMRMFQQSYENEGLKGGLLNFDFVDVKASYQDYTGQYNIALPGRTNTGIGDCKATLAVIKEMAAGGKTTETIDNQ